MPDLFVEHLEGVFQPYGIQTLDEIFNDNITQKYEPMKPVSPAEVTKKNSNQY